MTWRYVGAVNDRLEWVTRSLGATFVDPNSWIRDLDFGREGLRLNRNGARELGDHYSRVCGIYGVKETGKIFPPSRTVTDGSLQTR